MTIPASELQKVASLGGASLDHQLAYIELNYQTAAKASVAGISGDKAEKVEFTNSASASSSGCISFPEGSSTVSKEQPVLSKESAIDLSKEDGRVKYVKYTVKVNPFGATLNSGNELILSDIVDAKAKLIGSLVSVKNLKTGEILANASVDIQSVKDASGKSTSELTISIPDSTPVLVEYWVAPNLAVGSDLSLSNTVNLIGNHKWNTTNGYSGKVLRADAYVRGLAGSISVVKYDKSDRDKKLDGAEFKLYRVDMNRLVELGDSPTDEQIAGISSLVSVKTTSGGQVVFDKDGDRSLSLYSLYYFKETKAPVVDGVSYEISDPSPQYFMLRNIYAETSEEIQKDKEEYDAAYAKVKDSNLSLSDAHSYEMRDAKTGNVSVPVQKIWEGKEGDAATFELFANGVSTGKTLTLTANDGWTGVFDGLEKFDGDGNEIAYTVEEQCIADYDSVQQTSADGTVVFTNTYKAPSLAPASAVPSVEKSVTGVPENWAMPADAFSFTLTQKSAPEGAQTNATQVKKNPASGDSNASISFDSLTFDKEGTYIFELAEDSVDGSKAPGVTKDSTVYAITYEVGKKDGANELEIKSVKVEPSRTDASYEASVSDQKIPFVNSYAAASASVSLAAKKTLDNAALAAGQFSFSLKQASAPEGVAFADEQVKANDADGDIIFDGITYNKPGIYEYSISEVVPEGAVNGVKDGMTYDLVEHAAQVEVTDDGKGQLHASVKYDDDKSEAPTFTNSYTKPAPSATSFTAQVKKQLDGGRVLKDQEFEFVLKKGDKEIAHAKNAADGTVRFENVAVNSIDDGGEYTISEVKGADSSVEYSDQVVKVNVDVTESDGKLNASVTYGDGKTTDIQTITNTFKPASVSAIVEASKALDGRALSDGEFAFQLKEDDGVVAEATNEADGSVSFPAISYNSAGEHDYTISEVIPEGTIDNVKDGVTYDATTRKAHVSVTQNTETGALTATVSYPDDGNAAFTNTYKAKETSVSLAANKSLMGKQLADAQFQFQVKEGDSVVSSSSNSADGGVRFPEINYSEAGEHDYAISEVVPDGGIANGVTYDQSVYKVHVSVKDNGEGQLVPEVVYEGSDTPPTFTNKYEATGSVTLSVAKQVNGANPSSGQSFSYELIPIGSAPMPEGKESLTTSTLGSVASSFDSIPYRLDDAGKKFEYRIHETTPQTVGWTMAGDVIAKVTVGEDNGDGILKPSTVEYVKAENDQVSASVDDQNSAALFNNLYQQASGKFQLGLTKTVNGSAPLKGETFGFAATAVGDNAADAPKLGSVTTDENGEAKFAEATLADKDAGKTYTYRIHEVSDLADGSGSWTKAPDVIATVQVSDRSSSNELAATVSYKQDSNNAESYEGAAAFNNLHADKKAETVLKVSKTVNGAEDKNLQKQFGFQLQPKDGAPMPKSDVVTVTGTTSASFGKIVYDKVGIYNYVIHESSEAGSGWTNADDVEATVEVGYAENGRDLVVKSIKYNNRQTDAATFNNTYEATGSVTLSVAKQVNGKSPLANEKFQFQLAGQDGAPMPAEGTTCETVGSEPAQLGSIPFALADAGKTYIYTITETTQGSSEWKIAGPVTATVTVGKDNGDGTLSAPTVTYSVSGMNGGAALFNNTYETSTQATVNVHKTVKGGTDKVKNESFDFELRKADEQGNMTDEVVGTVSAKADETKSFNPIKYTTSDAGKTFTYWIHEKGHNDKGWTADKDTKVTVKVVENADRSLSAEVSYERGTSAAEFTNAYATSGQATLSVFKTVNGGTEQGAGQKFHFDLYKADDQGNAQGEKVDSVETVVGEKASFGAIDLSGEGTYHYVIKESGYNNGAWFAAGDVIATVTATDNGDGTLKTEVAYSNPDADKSAALFDNVYAPTNASIWVKKTVNGEAAPVDKHFTFELQAQDGAPMPGEATADTFGGDTCSFGDIEFTEEGEYRYVIHETADLGEGWTNAADVPVTVKVVRDEDAKMLKVESISYGDSVFEENGQAMALFDNKYEAPEKPDQPNGETPKADTPNSEGDQPVASDGAKSSGTKTGDSMILAGGALALVAVAAAGIAAFALRRRK